jgi:hypothetical protein
VNKCVEVEHFKNPSIMTLMYSQLSMVGEPSTDDCKPLGTHRTLGLISIIDELNSMEGDPLKGEH